MYPMKRIDARILLILFGAGDTSEDEIFFTFY